jgi:AAA15 family ATPase/GTPase
MVAYHAKHGGGMAMLETWQESDGVRRAIDLLLTFLWMASIGSTYVLVIDELDRSLHTLLTRKLLDSYLSSCSKDTRTQLLFTTHDVMLMDQGLLRRDEMWVTERDGYGASTLTSLLEYEDIRIDTDVRKAYLHGRLGGVPNVLLDSVFSGLRGKGGEGA